MEKGWTMIKQTAAYIDASGSTYEIKDIGDPNIIGPINFGLSQYKQDRNTLCFGSGVLAGTPIPGAKRMMFTGYSNLWENFYISTMGGAAFVFHKTGLNYVSIRGKAQKPTIIKINRKEGNLSIEFVPVDDLDGIWKGYGGMIGTYALQKWVCDRFGSEFKECRILVTGPAAKLSRNGAIMSAPILAGKISPVDCWAGRGGIGSELLQTHGIAAVIYGGDHADENPALKDIAHINTIFEEHFKRNMLQEDMADTVKYRYNPTLHTGGTLGVNYTKLKGWMFSFNYQSVYWTEDERLDLHKRFVLDHYLKQFNEDTIDKKQFRHCGEPCAVVCKKMNGEFKKDYEPYQTFGPNCGIFDQGAAERINHHADAMGFDTITAGSVVSWIMELLSKGKIKKEDFGLTLDPKFDRENFDVVADSNHNADAAIEIVKMITYSDQGAVFRHGIRDAAKELGQKYGFDAVSFAAYNAYGEHGCMVPNQYWVPGMFSPMPILGKYFCYYGTDFMPPRELGKKNVQRMVNEFAIDNAGMCRFHRGWAEKIMNDIINDLYKTDYDVIANAREMARTLNAENRSVFWESERVIDIIRVYLEKMLVGEPDNAVLKDWVDRFRADKMKAARAYWEEIKAGIQEALQ